MTMSTMSFEQYAAWATSRYPGYREEEGGDAVCHEAEAVARTEPPVSGDACPVTVRSSRDGVIVTPCVRRSK